MPPNVPIYNQNSADDFVGLEIPPAAKWNEIWENDRILADGTGIKDNTIGDRHIATGQIKKAHLDPSEARIDTRVQYATTNTITPDIDSFDMIVRNDADGNMTINPPTGTPHDGQALLFRFEDDGTVRTITWDANYFATGVTIPTATVSNRDFYISCRYNAHNGRWNVLSVGRE